MSIDITFAVVDLETENRNTKKFSSTVIGTNPSYQWHDENFIHMAGVGIYRLIDNRLTKCDINTFTSYDSDTFTSYLAVINSLCQLVDYVVFHNAKFDLLWLLTEAEGKHELGLSMLSEKYVRDTQLMAYMLTASAMMMPSLADTYEACSNSKLKLELSDGIHPGKGDVIKRYADAGKTVSQIPEKVLSEYLVGDLDTTAYCYAILHTRTKELDKPFTTLIDNMHSALLATVTMEYNGMYYNSEDSLVSARTIDKWLDDTSSRSSSTIAKLTDRVVTGIKEHIKDYENWLVSFLTSPSKLSILLFGGDLKVQVRELKYDSEGRVETYKTGPRAGEFKSRLVSKEVRFPRLVSPHYAKSSKGINGIYSTNDNNIQTILDCLDESKGIIDRSVDTEVLSLLLRRIQQIRMYKKISSTYLGAYPGLTVDGLIHHNLNMTRTATGRLSSTNPNLQNVTSVDPTTPKKAQVKTYFVSRFKNGYLVEADYSQLEVVILAVLSGCKKMIQDLRDGVDTHTRNAMKLYDYSGEHMVSSSERKLAKRLSFELQYGASAKSMAANHDLPEALTQKFIDNYFADYPEVARYHGKWITQFKRKGKGKPAVVLDSPTGRRLLFKRTQSGGVPTTTLKNYPIQSVATGDLVPIAFAYVNSTIKRFNRMKAGTEREKSGKQILLINTIHDSILLDVYGVDKAFVKMLLEDTMVRDVRGHMSMAYGIKIPDGLLKIEVKAGDSWADMSVI